MIWYVLCLVLCHVFLYTDMSLQFLIFFVFIYVLFFYNKGIR